MNYSLRQSPYLSADRLSGGASIEGRGLVKSMHTEAERSLWRATNFRIASRGREEFVVPLDEAPTIAKR